MSKNLNLEYHNDMNKISFAGFNEKELNLFFVLVFLAKDKKTDTLIIPFSDLKVLAENFDRNRERFIKNLNSVNKKLIALNHQVKIEDTTYTFSLFNVFGVDEKNSILTVKINEMFSYMLNDLPNFTRFDLIDFVSLKSIYSKKLFRLLKQWESKKKRIFNIEEFRDSLDIPKNYRMCEIDTRVLKPIMIELSEYLPNLKLEKIKSGKNITSLDFNWKKNKEEIIEGKTVEVKISENLEKSILKAKKNIYINKFLEDVHIKELLEIFKEEQLIDGLEYSYKHIKEEFKKLVYLENSIRCGIKNREIKIVTIAEPMLKNENIEKEVKIELEQTCIKTKVTQNEFEDLYNKFLKNNNFGDNPITKTGFKKGFEIVKLKITEEEKLELEIKEMEKRLKKLRSYN